ncbi:type II toxin-antitoxin system mRNA interferase toxin YafO, partial [Escherichia coli]|nr:type II toxin-antitoxin system mRNA interferase toxin YafO [Escherichia coli]
RDGVLPDIFGRDALYDDSFTWPLIKFERVAHIHLANENNPFPPQLRQFSRTNDEAHLVYCQGAFDEQAWLLIAILKPEPHKLARDNNQMHKIGKMAEAFRMRF